MPSFCVRSVSRASLSDKSVFNFGYEVFWRARSETPLELGDEIGEATMVMRNGYEPVPCAAIRKFRTQKLKKFRDRLDCTRSLDSVDLTCPEILPQHNSRSEHQRC